VSLSFFSIMMFAGYIKMDYLIDSCFGRIGNIESCEKIVAHAKKDARFKKLIDQYVSEYNDELPDVVLGYLSDGLLKKQYNNVVRNSDSEPLLSVAMISDVGFNGQSLYVREFNKRGIDSIVVKGAKVDSIIFCENKFSAGFLRNLGSSESSEFMRLLIGFFSKPHSSNISCRVVADSIISILKERGEEVCNLDLYYFSFMASALKGGVVDAGFIPVKNREICNYDSYVGVMKKNGFAPIFENNGTECRRSQVRRSIISFSSDCIFDDIPLNPVDSLRGGSQSDVE
jgi:hypothetical protein